MPHLIWFRRDLRCHDNPALSAACRDAKDGVIALFIITPQMWKLHNNSACQVDFILRQLQSLQNSLSKVNIPLLIRKTTANESSLKAIRKVLQEFKVNQLFYNIEYEIDELKRDKLIDEWCHKNNIVVQQFHDQVLLEPGSVRTGADKFYTVFTPFKRAVYKKLKSQGIGEPLTKPRAQKKLKIKSDDIPKQLTNFKSAIDTNLWPVGENHALKKLTKFCESQIQDYAKYRDFPAVNGTSQLSHYLTIGVISIKQCLWAAMNANQGRLEGGRKGIDTWISELIWREFYRHILVGFPRVCMNRPFRLSTENIPWKNNKEYFKAWCEGQTGIPIVDAAMRQLMQTGWMHNRLRMIVAMFLTKNCLIDWRWGEKYFMQHLIDGDFASNNGGWQWSASTGTDAAPYFRIMNPVSQSERFDPQGEFIRQYCPELKALDNKVIHNPSIYFDKLPSSYPRAIVDLKATRARAIETFKQYLKQKI